MRKKLAWYLVAAIDLLLAGAILCTFCYFHHVRILWGDGGNEEVKEHFGKDDNNTSDDTLHLEHKWELSETVKESCTEEGYTKYICECGDSKIENRTAPTGHRNVETIGQKEATEEENGYTGDRLCKDCNTVIQHGSEIPAKKHKNTVLINKKDSTCSEEGYSGDWLCTDCGEKVAVGAKTPLAEHSYEEHSKIEADCVNEGYTLYQCKECGAQRKGDYVPRGEHSMGADGCCIGCKINMVDRSGDFGASFPMMFIQDENKINLKDDAEIRKYALDNGITLQDHKDGTFIGLYRSHDIFISLLEVNTELYYKVNGKTYTVQYFVYDVYVRNIENLFTYHVTKRDYSTEELIEKAEKEISGGQIIATINGDYIGNKNHCLIAERNGNVLRIPEILESDACVLYYDGTLETFTPETYDWELIKSKNPYQIWNFGPALLDENGKAIEEYDDSSYDDHVIDKRNPRAAIGYYEPGHYSLVVVDGRSDDSDGVRMVQLAWLYEELGCKVAYNMDGGDSSQAYWEYEMIRGDEERGDDQRNLYDIICVGEVSKDD